MIILYNIQIYIQVRWSFPTWGCTGFTELSSARHHIWDLEPPRKVLYPQFPLYIFILLNLVTLSLRSFSFVLCHLFIASLFLSLQPCESTNYILFNFISSLQTALTFSRQLVMYCLNKCNIVFYSFFYSTSGAHISAACQL